MNEQPQRKINKQELRELGFSEAAIEEACERERRNLLNIEPPAGLLENAMDKCLPIFEAEKHQRRMEANFLYRTFHNVCDYVKSLYT